METKGLLVKITKISDDKFGGNHPNEINEGYQQTAIAIMEPTIDQCYYLGSLRTSPVISYDPETLTFKTLNSTYKLTIQA